MVIKTRKLNHASSCSNSSYSILSFFLLFLIASFFLCRWDSLFLLYQALLISLLLSLKFPSLFFLVIFDLTKSFLMSSGASELSHVYTLCPISRQLLHRITLFFPFFRLRKHFSSKDGLLTGLLFSLRLLCFFFQSLTLSTNLSW